MQEGYICMSSQEISRLEIIQRVVSKTLKQKQAAKILGVTTRQIKRLVKNFRATGPIALISKRRGKPSNHRHTPAFTEQVIKIIKQEYSDFGPTLASEKLFLREGIKISVEKTRKLMIKEGLWKPKIAKEKVIHPPRLRRACYGELIQIDGSPHDWFENRGPKCTLIVFIDDATSKIQLLRFFEAETTFAYFNMMRLYIARYGKPAALYSDRYGVFKVNAKEPKTGNGKTQFGRAMEDLAIELIHANSPQAKGRVERANSTLQDRLVKELRLEGISDMNAANQFFLDQYIDRHNTQFSVTPRELIDAHQPWVDLEQLALCFTLQSTRSVQKNLTLQYKNTLYQIEAPGKGYRLRQAKVTVCESESGEIILMHNGQSLSYKVYDKQQHFCEAVSRKELDGRLKRIQRTPAANHPWKQYATLNALKNASKRKAVTPGPS